MAAPAAVRQPTSATAARWRAASTPKKQPRSLSLALAHLVEAFEFELLALAIFGLVFYAIQHLVRELKHRVDWRILDA